MGTKNNPGKYDCYTKAEPDEPIFVLLGRDWIAPDLIRQWANIARLNGVSEDKYREAMICAEQMEEWYNKHSIFHDQKIGEL